MLIGREREVAHIEGLLDAGRRGESSALLVTGDAGIGKSALLGEAGERAQALGIRVLRTRGFESESDIAFAGLLELLTPLLGLRDRIPEVQAAALGSALALEPPSPHDRFAVPAGVVHLPRAPPGGGARLAPVDDRPSAHPRAPGGGALCPPPPPAPGA